MNLEFNFESVLPPNTTISEEAVEKLAGLKVPVTMRGIMVGVGELRDDGTFVVETEKSTHGRALLQMLLEGAANCISIGPNPKGPIAQVVERSQKDGN